MKTFQSSCIQFVSATEDGKKTQLTLKNVTENADTSTIQSLGEKVGQLMKEPVTETLKTDIYRINA